MENLSIFDVLYEEYKITKPIRLIELFAGYGSQALALKYLGANFEHYKISEWAIKSIQAYKNLHFADSNIDYAKDKTDDEIIRWLSGRISQNYNEPIFEDKIKKLDYRKIYNNMKNTNNIGSICMAKGEDLEITDTDKYDYILTYSFPCQDLSLAGKRAGMEKDSGTRSGLLWEVERLLNECENKPQILLMENVTQVHSNMQLFNSFIIELEKLGYKSYWQDLSATDFEIPQTRVRTFMISLLGDYNYKFPKKKKLKLKLKDLLEDNVDEKYYLSSKMINYISRTGTENYHNSNAKINLEIARPVTTDQNKRAGTTNYISYDLPESFDLASLNSNNKNLIKTAKKIGNIDEPVLLDCYNKKVIKNTANTILTGVSFRNQTFLTIPNATKKGYLEAHEGDGVDLESFGRKGRRGTVQKEKSQTIKTQDTLGVVVSLKRGYSVEVQEEKEDSENIDVIGNYSKSNFCQTPIVGKNGLAPTVTGNHGEVTAIAEKTLKLLSKNKAIKETIENKDILKRENYIQWKQKGHHDIDCRAYFEDKVAPTTTTTPKGKVLLSNLRIRKLTPRECGRLMGVKDEDIDLLSKNQSNSSLYHLFGDSIVVNVLMAIFSQLL